MDPEIKNGAQGLNNGAISLLEKTKEANNSLEMLVKQVQERRALQEPEKNGITEKLETAMNDLKSFKLGEISSAKTKLSACDSMIQDAGMTEQLVRTYLK